MNRSGKHRPPLRPVKTSTEGKRKNGHPESIPETVPPGMSKLVDSQEMEMDRSNLSEQLEPQTALPKAKPPRPPLRPLRRSPAGIEKKAEPARQNDQDSNLPKSIPAQKNLVSKTEQVEESEVFRKNKRLELLITITKQFNTTLDFNELMVSFFKKVISVLEAEAGSFWLPDAKKGENLCSIAEGPAKKQVQGLKLKEGQGIVGWVIENKQNATIFDASKDPRFSGKVDEKTKFVTRSMLCIPLLVQNECVGAIQVINKKSETGQFDVDDLEMLENLATSGAIAIKNARLYESEQRIKELNTLLNISKELTSTLDLDRVLLSVVNLASQAIDYKRAVVALLDINDQVYIAAESDQAQPDASAEENVRLKKIMDEVISSGKSLYITHYKKGTPQKAVPKSVEQYMDEYQLQSLSTIILTDSEGNLGLLSMEGAFPTLIPQESKSVVDMLVNQASIAIRNAELYQNISAAGVADRFKSGLKLTTKTWRRILMAGTLFIFALFAILNLTIPANILSDVEVIPDHKTQVTTVSSGRVKNILFKEGESVKQGQVLIELDTSLLDLEKAKLENDKSILVSMLRQLESEDRPSDVYLKQLELEKLDNRLASINQKLGFAKIKANRGGTILTIKPEELVNKQITEGEVVAEIAVGNRKRAHLFIKEIDILNVNRGNEVDITLQALPGVIFAGSLEDITHVKIADEEENENYIGYFVSNDLNENQAVRFGMTGKSKIYIGQRTFYQLYFESRLLYSMTRFKLLISQ